MNINDICWWEFDSLLESILLTDNSAIGKVLSYRSYKKPSNDTKAYAQKEHEFYEKMKRTYSLNNNQVNGLEKLYNFTSQKAGEKNGK